MVAVFPMVTRFTKWEKKKRENKWRGINIDSLDRFFFQNNRLNGKKIYTGKKSPRMTLENVVSDHPGQRGTHNMWAILSMNKHKHRDRPAMAKVRFKYLFHHGPHTSSKTFSLPLPYQLIFISLVSLKICRANMALSSNSQGTHLEHFLVAVFRPARFISI